MRSSILWPWIVTVAILGEFAFSSNALSATINTTRGTREGRVIVRKTVDRLVVTVLTQDKRLFQYYARDVISITAPEKILVGKAAPLIADPTPNSTPIMTLLRGQEVELLENKANSNKKNADKNPRNNPPDSAQWIQVKVWGDMKGWISSDCLTDAVTYTAEEKSIPAQKNSPADATPSAAPEPPASATQPIEKKG